MIFKEPIYGTTVYVNSAMLVFTVLNVSFVETSMTVREGVGVVEFTLQKGGRAVGPVSVQLYTTDDTAQG